MSTIAERLAEAEQAYHKLAIGQHVQLVQEDGTRVEYAPADLNKLDQYIQRLRVEAGQSNTRRRGTRQMIL